jgi:hypothetical protein
VMEVLGDVDQTCQMERRRVCSSAAIRDCHCRRWSVVA